MLDLQQWTTTNKLELTEALHKELARISADLDKLATKVANSGHRQEESSWLDNPLPIDQESMFAFSDAASPFSV